LKNDSRSSVDEEFMQIKKKLDPFGNPIEGGSDDEDEPDRGSSASSNPK
jgi:hypothetical protein